MNGVPCIPNSAPFTSEQRAWLNGLLAGLYSDANATAERKALPAPGADARAEPLLLMYGSQTGSAEGVARRMASEARTRGFEPRVVDMSAFESVDLTREQRLLIVTSTWGDGDPPDNAVAFWNHLNSEQAPRLDHLEFSVLALGDRNYSEFCGAGKKFDARLEQLGARRLHPRTDCDTDYEEAAREWMEGLWKVMAEGLTVSSQRAAGSERQMERTSGSAQPAMDKPCSRRNPFPGSLMRNFVLNGPGSEKETRHFEISLSGSGLTYETGDALGVVPANCPALVDEIIRALGCDGEEAVSDPDGNETALRSALLRRYAIPQPSRSLLEAVAGQSGDRLLGGLLEPANKAGLEGYLWGREVIDLLLQWPDAKFTPAEFVGFLRKLQPRLYSIASSPTAHPGEVHLTVAIVRYESHGRRRKGVCSTFLADRVEGGTAVPVFVQPSHGFRLPLDGTKPIIMVGPGTGIAPFRAFLEERRATGAKGRNWLFFGDRRRDRDFLYRDQLEGMAEEGTLTRLDAAFSRDQAEKVYVQHRMREHAKQLWSWLEDGAHFYVCGDARRMARDVEAALHEIIERAGGRTAEQASEYVRQLKAEKRYQRDVY